MRVADAGPERKLWKAVCGDLVQAAQLPAKERDENAAPCRVCGVGVQCAYRLCRGCGGKTVNQRLMRKGKKAKKDFDLVLLELKATQLEK